MADFKVVAKGTISTVVEGGGGAREREGGGGRTSPGGRSTVSKVGS